jgi:hypothetical protein
MTSYVLSGQYSVEVESSFINRQCVGTYTIIIEGDAGPFSFKMYDSGGRVLDERSDLSPDVYTITEVAQNLADGSFIEVFDAYGCSCIFEDLAFDCDCDDIEPEVIIEQEPCNDSGGSLLVPAMSDLFTTQSVEWIDMDNYVTSSDQRLVENLPAGEYCGLFTFTTTIFDQGSLVDCKDLRYCFEVLPCLCRSYQPIETIVDATEGQSDGSISLDLTYGAPADFRWDNGMVGSSISGLSEGTYTVTVTGTAASCAMPLQYTYEVDQKCNLLISGNPDEIRYPICNNDNGYIKFNLSDPSAFDIAFGDPPYNWQLTNVGSSEIMPSTLIYDRNGVSERIYLSLRSGDYELQITDSNRCTDYMIITLVEEQETDILQVLSESIVASCTGMDNGMVEFFVSSSSIITAIDIILSNGLSERISKSNGSVKFKDLPPGRYSAEFIDYRTGCSIVENFNISEQEIIPFDRNREEDIVIKPFCKQSGSYGILQQNIIGNPPFTYDPPEYLTTIDRRPYEQYTITDHCGQTWISTDSPNSTTVAGYEDMVCGSFIFNENDSEIHSPTQAGNDGYINIAHGVEQYSYCTNSTIEWIRPPLGSTNPIQGLSSGVYTFELRSGDCYEQYSVVLENCAESNNSWGVEFVSISPDSYNCTSVKQFKLDFDIPFGNWEENVEIVYKDLDGNVILVEEKRITENNNYEMWTSATLPNIPIRIFAVYGCEIKFVKELNFGCDDCGYANDDDPNIPINFHIDHPCGAFLNTPEIKLSANASAHGEYILRYFGVEEDLSLHIIIDDSGVHYNGDNERVVNVNDEHYAGITVFDLNKGCTYRIEKLVGPKEVNCIAPNLKVSTFTNNSFIFEDNQSIIAGVNKVESCGEFDDNIIRFDQFDYYPFDAENPCQGGGIIKINCNPVYDFNLQKYFGNDESIYVINPCTPHEEFSSYNRFEFRDKFYFNCNPTFDSRLCIFDLLDKPFPLVVEYCSGLNPEVISLEGYEDSCSDNGIVYAIPGGIKNTITGCNFDIFCIERGTNNNFPCGNGAYDPLFVENINIEDCCLNITDDELLCNRICDCDVGYYNSSFTSKDVLCNQNTEYPDCGVDGFYVLENRHLACDKIRFRFEIPKDDTEVRVEIYENSVFLNCNNSSSVIDIEPDIQESKEFNIGEREWEVSLSDLSSANTYSVFVFFNSEEFDCFTIEHDCDSNIVDDPEGCELDITTSNRDDEWGVSFNISHNKSHLRPSVILGPISYNDEEPTNAKVTQVTEEGFKLKIEEWGYQDGVHGTEKISYQYASPGNYSFDGLQSEIGNSDDVSSVSRWIYFNKPFKSTPTLLVTQTSNNNGFPSSVRVERVTKTRFKVKLQSDDLSTNPISSEESISYMAFEKGVGSINGRKVIVGNTTRTLNQNWKKITFGLDSGTPLFNEPPLILASLQTNVGDETTTLRYQNLTNSSVEVMAQESNSYGKKSLNSQTLGYVMIETSNDCCQEGDISLRDSQVLHATCGSNSGSINVDPDGGTEPYTYQWSSGESTANISDLDKGQYILTVTDVDGCTSSKVFDIEKSNNLNLDNSYIKHPSCIGNIGSIHVYGYGGVKPYTYLWSDGNTNQIRNNLSEGRYRVTVTGVNGCKKVQSFDLKKLNLIDGYDTSPRFCNVDNGLIAGGAVGGTPPYSYLWDDGSTDQERFNLSSGSYYLTVTDADGCVETRRFFISSNNSITLNGFGGDEGLSEGRYVPAGVTIDWTFNPVSITDQLIIDSDVDGLILDTGGVTLDQQSCCNAGSCCSDFFLGDHAGTSISLLEGSGYVTPGQTSGSGCYSAKFISGEFVTENSGYLSINVVGALCSSGTGWSLVLSCSGSSKSLMEKLKVDLQPEKNVELLSSDRITSDNLSDIKIYPNPASESVYINIGIANKKYDVSLIDISGRTMLVENFNEIEAKLDLSGVIPGLYIIKVEIEDGRLSHTKLVVE